MEHPLDRPVWNSLHGRQGHLARRHGQALRLDPDYGPFAAAAPGGEADLALCLAAGADIWVVEPAAMPAPPGLQVLRTAPLVQMVADGAAEDAIDDRDLALLGDADVAEMTALARATEPGPWGPATCRYGPFYGLRQGDRLAAMAGERMRPGEHFAEVSGVCTWPEFRGQGFAARLIRRVMAGLRAQGQTPFLHSYAGNAAAIRLYETLGFRVRREMVATVLGREP